jgi:hypothetical protein
VPVHDLGKHWRLLCIVAYICTGRFYHSQRWVYNLSQKMVISPFLDMESSKVTCFFAASIPKWWIWAYYLSPLAYGESANTVNEFLDPRWVLSVPNL